MREAATVESRPGMFEKHKRQGRKRRVRSTRRGRNHTSLGPKDRSVVRATVHLRSVQNTSNLPKSALYRGSQFDTRTLWETGMCRLKKRGRPGRASCLGQRLALNPGGFSKTVHQTLKIPQLQLPSILASQLPRPACERCGRRETRFRNSMVRMKKR